MNFPTIHIPFDEELLPAQTLRFGSISCMYEHGRIRYVTCGGVELIRMVYFAVRDEEWNTSPYTIESESIKTGGDGFEVQYTALHSFNQIVYRSHVSITATNDTITFSVQGEALSNFRRNRVGICVLHPIMEGMDKQVAIERPDGTKYQSSFPDLINPHQPFKEIRKMRCSISHDVGVELVFSGDIFETEDQRNWGDSSFKTYSTPLSIPFPVQVGMGEKLEQKVYLKFTIDEGTDDKTMVPREKKIAFPKIGYCSFTGQLTKTDIERLLELPFDHYRVELSFKDVHWKETLVARIGEATSLHTLLELVLVFDENDASQFEDFITAMKPNSSVVASILIIHPGKSTTNKDVLNTAYRRIKEVAPGIEVGYGTGGFFADLNRNRPPADTIFDFVSFSLTPQVHAFDTRTVLENLHNLPDLIQTSKSFCGGKKIHVSPITFKIRTDALDKDGLPVDADSRQHRSFGALWTLQAIKNLGEADRLTFYDVKGYRGILNRDDSDNLSPVFHLLKRIKEFGPKWIILQEGERTLLPDIILEKENGQRLKFDCQSARAVL